jgi:hypothetical protein
MWKQDTVNKQTHSLDKVLLQKLVAAQLLKKFMHSMGPEVLQDPTTGLYPEPTESNPYPPILSFATTARCNLRLRMEETADKGQQCIYWTWSVRQPTRGGLLVWGLDGGGGGRLTTSYRRRTAWYEILHRASDLDGFFGTQDKSNSKCGELFQLASFFERFTRCLLLNDTLLLVNRHPKGIHYPWYTLY